MPSRRAEVVGPVEAHPTDAQAFGARGQPEVLDRARRRVDVGLGDRAAPENLAVGVAVVAADDEPSGASTTPSIFWSRNWRARSSKRSAWRSRSRWASRRTSTRVVGIAHTISRHGCMSPTDGARCAASRIRSQDVVGDLVRLGSAGCRDARRSCGRPPRARRRDSASPSGRRRARRPGSRRIPAASAGGRSGLGRTRAGTVEWRPQAWRREEAGENPARSRHCDRVVLRPEVRNSLATNPFECGTPDPAEVAPMDSAVAA